MTWLPDYNRVIYEKNPLVEVVCQLRFPPILSIETEIPSEFQKGLIEQFPFVEEKKELHQAISSSIDFSQINTNGISNPVSTVTSNKIYVFSSENNNLMIGLTRTSISLTTQKYSCWEDFITYFRKPIELLQKIYGVKFLTRIGLRYIDLFKKSELGLSETPWKKLIKAPMAGVLSEIDESSINAYNSDFALSLEEDMQIFVRAMLVKEAKSGELCFMLDSDLFTQTKTAIANSLSILKKLNINANKILQFAIQEELHNAMKPKKLEK